MPKLRNVSPLGALDVVVLGRIVEAGEEFDVPASIAGRAPSWSPLEDGDDVPSYLTRETGDVVEKYDPGTGLLANTEAFVLVEKSTRAAKSTTTNADDTSETATSTEKG